MLPEIDILCLHCPLTPSTRGLISKQQLNAMKKGSVLVNMSRGAVVDELALAEALKGGEGETISAAASDVFGVEPAQREVCGGLMELRNFIGTPHM